MRKLAHFTIKGFYLVLCVYAHTHTYRHTNTWSVHTHLYYPIIPMISSAEVLVSCRAAIQHIGLKQNMLQL